MQDHALRALSVVIYALNCRTLAEFYAKLLRLGQAEEGDGFIQLVGDGMEIVVVQAPPAVCDSIVMTSPLEIRSDTPIKLSFAVVDAEALRSVIESAGGGLKPPEAAWSWAGAWHLDGWDPEGNVFQLRQRAA